MSFSLLRIILIPLSVLYCGITLLRNKLYDWKILRTHQLSKPVISIGNITTGGTGKTPFTIHAAKYFLDKGKTTGIVSRGYGRSSDETVVVSDGKTIENNIEKTGDELRMIAGELIQKYQGKFFIAAGNNKTLAAQTLIDKFNPDLIILDDSFQHRQLKRDLDIVIFDAGDHFKNRFQNSLTLPSGKLRESYSGLSRADIIIQNDKAGQYSQIDMLKKYSADVAVMRYKTEYIIDHKNRILEDKNKKAIVFSGIADDSSFIEMINQAGLKTGKIIKYPDHHKYTLKDLKDITDGFTDEQVFVTTEKDFVKITKLDGFTDKYPVYFLKLKTEISGNEAYLKSAFDGILK